MSKDEIQDVAPEESYDDSEEEFEDESEEDESEVSEEESDDESEESEDETDWEAEVRKRDAIIARLQKKQIKNKKGREITTPKKEQSDEDWKRKMEFTIAHRDLDSEQVEFVLDMAQSRGTSPEKVLNDSRIKSWIEQDKKDKRLAQATPDGSSGSKKSKKSLVEKVKTGELSEAEMEANYNQIISEYK
jgi:hypothetical protein